MKNNELNIVWLARHQILFITFPCLSIVKISKMYLESHTHTHTHARVYALRILEKFETREYSIQCQCEGAHYDIHNTVQHVDEGIKVERCIRRNRCHGRIYASSSWAETCPGNIRGAEFLAKPFTEFIRSSNWRANFRREIFLVSICKIVFRQLSRFIPNNILGAVIHEFKIRISK